MRKRNFILILKSRPSWAPAMPRSTRRAPAAPERPGFSPRKIMPHMVAKRGSRAEKRPASSVEINCCATVWKVNPKAEQRRVKARRAPMISGEEGIVISPAARAEIPFRRPMNPICQMPRERPSSPDASLPVR